LPTRRITSHPAWTGNFNSSTSGSLAAGANHYLFFDNVHPTALAHQLTADLGYQALTAAHPVSPWA